MNAHTYLVKLTLKMSCRGLKCSSGVFLSDKSSRFPSAFLSFKKDPDEQARISSFGVFEVGLDEA